VRNPWARFASLYRFLKGRERFRKFPVPETFAGFVAMADRADPELIGLYSMRDQAPYFAQAPMPVFIGHFEHLVEDFFAVTRDLELALALPHLNAARGGQDDYRALYSDDDAGIVARLFAGDIARFGYVFDRPEPQVRISRWLDPAEIARGLTSAPPSR
jgi:hypothetical protein